MLLDSSFRLLLLFLSSPFDDAFGGHFIIQPPALREGTNHLFLQERRIAIRLEWWGLPVHRRLRSVKSGENHQAIGKQLSSVDPVFITLTARA